MGCRPTTRREWRWTEGPPGRWLWRPPPFGCPPVVPPPAERVPLGLPLPTFPFSAPPWLGRSLSPPPLASSDAVAETAIEAMRDAGAVIVDPAELVVPARRPNYFDPAIAATGTGDEGKVTRSLYFPSTSWTRVISFD